MESAKRFRYEELWQAPDVPGIYAWYVMPNVRPDSVVDLKSDMTKLALQLVQPARRVEISGDLQFQLTGDAQQVPYTSERFSALIESTIESARERHLFAKILNVSAGYCMTPLYIGVATSLRTRLHTHQRLIEAAKEWEVPFDDRTAEGNEWMVNARFLAERIVQRGIRRTSLYVDAYPLDHDGVPRDISRKTCEAVETFLNRIVFPPLGRR
jgi:hypothetical protein